MTASPTVVTFRRPPVGEDGVGDAYDQFAAFVWGSDGLLYHHHQFWQSHGTPPELPEIGSGAGLIKDRFYFIYAYVVGSDGHLYVCHSTNYVSQASWNWVDLGRPTPNTGVRWFWRPGIVPFFFNGLYRLYTFVAGEDGHLWGHVWRGREPGSPQSIARDLLDFGTWSDQGAPAAGVLVTDLDIAR